MPTDPTPTDRRRPETPAERSWTYLDRSRWAPGPWDREPDKIQWKDAETGLPCLIVRNTLGNLCGYVGVDSSHPWHGIDYGQCFKRCDETWCGHRPDSMIEVHGGLTYADACQTKDRERGICHIPEAGEPDDVWWFGFDCAHSGDLMPYEALRSPGRGIYRSVEYVKHEVAKLAKQLAEVAEPRS